MKENEEAFNRYSREMLANGYSPKTMRTDAWALKALQEAFPDRRFEELTKTDLVEFFAEAPSKYSLGSIHLMKARVKHFYAWLHNCERGEYPESVRWIRTNNPQRGSKTKGIVTSISAEDVLKDEDVVKLVEAADHPRDKAMIMVLFESAAEAQELLNMKVKDVIRDREATKVALHGATGVRYIRIHHASPYIFSWLNIHPRGEDPDAALWGICYSNLNRILSVVKKRSGIKKPASARALRHAGLTKWAKVMPEQLLKLFAGWRPDSKMAAIYVHLSGADLDEATAKLYGEQPLEQKEYKIKGAEPIKCARCREVNPPQNLYCSRCGADLEQVPYDSVERRFQTIRDSPEKWMEFLRWYREKGWEKDSKQDSF